MSDADPCLVSDKKGLYHYTGEGLGPQSLVTVVPI